MIKNGRRKKQMKVNIRITDVRWSKVNLRELCRKGLLLSLSTLEDNMRCFEISILACGVEEITELNYKFRQVKKPTDILSWPEFDFKNRNRGEATLWFKQIETSQDDKVFLGNMALSYDQCVADYLDKEILIDDHLTHLIVHGCLHLLGYDHKKISDARLMESTEKKLLESVGIRSPYHFN